MEHKDYSVEELIHDSSFRKYAEGRASAEEIERWSRWIESSDKNRAKAKKAFSEIAGFSFTVEDKPGMQEEWRKLYEETHRNFSTKGADKKKKKFALRWVYHAAASLILICTVGISVYLYQDAGKVQTHLQQITQEETVSTNREQQKTLTFRNRGKTAKIVLNSNSKLTYNYGLIEEKPIEVTLEGEAYFDVEEGFSSKHPAFSVNTPDGVIRDLGTEFLVSVENDLSRVILQEGRVQVNTVRKDGSSRAFEIGKNQLVEFSRENVIQNKEVNSSLYTSWATGFIEFDKTTIDEFARLVEKRFSVEVEIGGDSLSDITLDGAVYFKSLEGLVRSVSDITNISVYQSGNRDTVYIGNLRNTN